MTKNKVIVIKKYPNRRLYNTETSKYITLDDLSALVKQNIEFKVIDIKTNDDLTRVTLAQIILDHEIKGYEMLPIDVLKHIIRLYDHPLNQTFSSYLMNSVTQFNQQMDQFKGMLGNMTMPFASPDWQKNMDEFNAQNKKFFEDMMKSFGNKH